MIKVILDCGAFFKPRARYVWDTFFTYYKARYQYLEPGESKRSGFSEENKQDLMVYCGPESESGKLAGAVLVCSHEQATGSVFQRGQMPSAPTKVNGVPLLFGPQQGPAVSRQGEKLICRADVLATAFFYLSAYQEYVSPESVRDEYGRYPFAASYQANHGIMEIPVVNQVFELIAGWLRDLGQPVKRVGLPGNRSFALVLSHDVDRMSFYRAGWPFGRIRSALAELLKYRRTAEALCHFEGLFHNPHNTFRRIARIHRKVGARDSFFFVFAGKRHPMDPDYFINSRRMRKVLGFLEKDGFELGLHGSFSSIMEHSYPEELEFARSLTAMPIDGGRIHYLRFQVQQLFELLESVGMKYDNSLAFAESPGFRTGMGLPHLMFDHKSGKPFSTLAIPLNIMDTTLFDKRYLGLNLEDSLSVVNRLLETASSLGICLSILTHNDFYLYSNYKAVKLYRKVLQQARDQGALLTDCGSIYRWWQSLQ